MGGWKNEKIRLFVPNLLGTQGGNVPGYHLLNKCELAGFNMAYQVVDFRNIYSVSLDFLCDKAKKNDKRLRLLPPYREHLSQAFARFFMRVGLPVDIPEFKKK